jgi:ABC-type sugar transport system ATPase subunit
VFTGVQTLGLTKRFGATRALDDVALTVEAGKVCALMGRNGAGKSTLVRILSGIERADAGEILLDGNPVSFRDPDEALRAGIATVHQEVAVIPGLTVAENVLLGRWESRAGFVSRRRNTAIARQALDLLGVSLDLDTLAGELRIAEQQLVEIARALSYQPRILILDEPTSSLTEWEAERLGDVVRRLAGHGVGILYVSHRMKEISRLADTVTVIRDGRIVQELAVADASVAAIASHMAGEELAESRSLGEAPDTDETALLVDGISTSSKVHDVSFSVRPGEIVGLAGRLGSGRTEILRAIAGIDGFSRGRITGPGGARLGSRSGPRQHVRAGVALVPEDRRVEGLVTSQPIMHNLVMSCLDAVAALGFLRPSVQRALAEKSRASTHLKAASLSDPVSSLSGGNQQKVVFGRCLNAGVRVLLLDEPTRGVDVQAKQQIFELVHDLAEAGCAIVLVSSEYGELVQNCHRILLIDDGTVVDELPPRVGLDELLAAIMRPSTDTPVLEETR